MILYNHTNSIIFSHELHAPEIYSLAMNTVFHSCLLQNLIEKNEKSEFTIYAQDKNTSQAFLLSAKNVYLQGKNQL